MASLCAVRELVDGLALTRARMAVLGTAVVDMIKTIDARLF